MRQRPPDAGCVDFPGFRQIFKAVLKGKSVGFKPVQECRLAKDACVGVLRGMNVSICSAYSQPWLALQIFVCFTSAVHPHHHHLLPPSLCPFSPTSPQLLSLSLSLSLRILRHSPCLITSPLNHDEAVAQD